MKKIAENNNNIRMIYTHKSPMQGMQLQNKYTRQALANSPHKKTRSIPKTPNTNSAYQSKLNQLNFQGTLNNVIN